MIAKKCVYINNWAFYNLRYPDPVTMKYKNIDVATKFKHESKQSSIKGLISIARILQEFRGFSLSAQTKLGLLRSLAEHPRIDYFTAAIYRLTSIRNPINHGDFNSLKSSNVQISLIDLENILFENGFLKILCDTKYSSSFGD